MNPQPTKNILFLLHLPPPVHGSSLVGQSISESKSLNRLFNCRYLNLLASDKVDQSGKISLGKIIGLVKIVFKLLFELVFHRPKLVYLALTLSSVAFYRDLLLISILKLFRVKRVFHIHNRGVRERESKHFYRLFYRFAFNNATVIILSESLYKDLEKFVPKNKIRILPNGIPVNEVLSLNKENTNPPQILFLSNLIESKGVFILLEALSQLKKKNILFETSFIGGEGDIRAELFQSKVEQLELQDRVQYLGKQYGADKEKAFAVADIFSFPTHYPNECFPLVILEAMQHSLPIVSTFEGGIPDMIKDGENGYLVQQKDVQSLANKLEYLILHPEDRLRMGRAGYKSYQENYTLEIFEKKLIDILQQEIN